MGVQSKKAVSPGKNGLKMGGKGWKRKYYLWCWWCLLQHPLRHAVRTAGKTATIQICRKQRRKLLPARQGRKRRPWFTVLLIIPGLIRRWMSTVKLICCCSTDWPHTMRMTTLFRVWQKNGSTMQKPAPTPFISGTASNGMMEKNLRRMMWNSPSKRSWIRKTDLKMHQIMRM